MASFAHAGRIHTEWLTANMSRAYPLDDSTGGATGTLPCRLLTDALLLITGPGITTDTEVVCFIHKVVSSSTEVTFHISSNVKDVRIDFGPVATFSAESKSGDVASFSVVKDNVALFGRLVLGDLSCLPALSAVLELSEAAGLLFPGCVRVLSDVLLGVKVDDTVFTGVVELKAGDGIELSVDEDKDAGITTITISAPEYRIPIENLNITNDDTLLTRALAIYGRPIRTINNISPDGDGNLIIAADEVSVTGKTESEEGDSMEQIDGEAANKKPITRQLVVTNANNVAGGLSITITDPQACDDTAMLEAALQNLQQLNQRATKLSETITALDVAQSNLAARVSGVL